MEEIIGNYKLIYDEILTQEQKISIMRQLGAEQRVKNLAGSCGGTITVVQQYRESVLQSCTANKSSAAPGESFSITATIAVGSDTESYKLVLTGDLVIESNILSISGINPTQNLQYIFDIVIPTNATLGAKNYAATLTKVVV